MICRRRKRKTICVFTTVSVFCIFGITLQVHVLTRETSILSVKAENHITVNVASKRSTEILPLSLCVNKINHSVPVSINSSIPTWQQLENRFKFLQDGGSHRPSDCQPKQRVAIIIPYRNRTDHLKLYLQHMHLFLQLQQLDYTIYVVEQTHGTLFNRGQLMNIGFLESSTIRRPDCVVLHDVDMLPADAMISYSCHDNVVNHPTLFVRQYGFKLPVGLRNYFGGVLILSEKTYRILNGFSNIYWGWGGEDDDFRRRVNAKRIPILQPIDKRLWFESWKEHPHEPVLINRMQFITRAVSRMQKDGLNSVDYTLLKVEYRPLYTWIHVALNDTKQYYKDLKPVHKPY